MLRRDQILDVASRLCGRKVVRPRLGCPDLSSGLLMCHVMSGGMIISVYGKGEAVMGEQPDAANDLAARWRRYFREQYSDERLLQIATDAAVSASLRRGSSDACAKAGTAAVDESRRHPEV